MPILASFPCLLYTVFSRDGNYRIAVCRYNRVQLSDFACAFDTDYRQLVIKRNRLCCYINKLVQILRKWIHVQMYQHPLRRHTPISFELLEAETFLVSSCCTSETLHRGNRRENRAVTRVTWTNTIAAQS